ncbi:MAG: DUF296 domain-containing protein [Rhodospirillales bacterium]|nr:DUF296 domain-containing protein [Rhodospirillales bacterium]
MRRLDQPGPAAETRIDACPTRLVPLVTTLTPGLTLAESVTRPLVEAGFTAATVRLSDATMAPFRYVRPGPADGPAHVAWFDGPYAPEGPVHVIEANLTFGWTDGAPALHCHATWIEPDGARRGGHILPTETILVAPVRIQAWGSTSVRIESAPDPETNFTLFQPRGDGERGAGVGLGVVARVKPNQDLTEAVETVAAAHGLRAATVRGSLGSLVGARFTDGHTVPDHATEVLVRHGVVRDGAATLELAVVDMRGEVHAGVLARGENAVCITFDLFLDPG